MTTFFATAQRNTTITLFPVPLTTNSLKVGMKSMTASKAGVIELRNFIGKKLQAVRCDGKSEVEFTDMRQYPEGVYVVLVKDKNGKIFETAKFTIAK